MNMDKGLFWQIIDEVNAEVPSTDLGGILHVTKEKLCQYSQQEIAVWSNYQRHYCGLADTSAVFAASCCLNTYMSDDGFNDFRMWLISQGKAVYLMALKDPNSLAKLGTPKDTTRFEPYGYIAYDAYDAWDMHGDVYEEKERNPLTEAQKAEMHAEIKYFPHRITSENAASYIPSLIFRYLGPDASLSFGYKPLDPAPSPADSLSGLDKLKEAASLIERMTGSRFKTGSGGAFIYSESDEYLAINMRKKADYGEKLYRIRFDANLQTMGRPMNAAGLNRLHQEIGVAHALLTALEMQDFTLPPEEMQAFNDFIHEQDQLRETQEKEITQGPVMGHDI